LTAIGQASGATLAALSGAFLLHRVAKFDNSLSRLRDALALILFGALGSAIVSASIGVAVLHASRVHAYSGLGSAWLIYWLGDSTGALLVTPLALSLPNLWRIRGWPRISEFIGLQLLLIGACAIAFANNPSVIPVRMTAFAILPLVIWAAIRFGVSGAALSILLAATLATVDTALGSGSFASGAPFVSGVQLDVFFVMLSLTGLTVAALHTEREQAEREREQSLRQQVAMEVRLQDEQLLRESEGRLRLAQQVARIGTFDWNIRTGVDHWTQELEEIHGLSPGSFPGTETAFENLVHPEDRARVIELANLALKTGQPGNGEWRVIWPDGSIHWIAARWQVFMDESGEALRMVGVNMDVTNRKLAEDALADVSRKLVQVQEEERMRIARDLHDDVNQRLAMLAIEIDQLKQSLPAASVDIDAGLTELNKKVQDVSAEVQTISHQLHSPQLEYLGVVGAIRSFCRDFASHQAVEIDFTNDDVPYRVSREVSLCLFRIVQESLHNALKHSGVKHFAVKLACADNCLDLTISDRGLGFDAEAATKTEGLGLVSMRERTHLVNGSFSIESKLMGGTTIHVRVPIGSGFVERRASGQ
jgi:PAS domain S-box-containing protein